MIDELSELKNKTIELENALLSLQEEQSSESSETNCLSYSRNFSNLEIILPKKILIARISPSKSSNILFQCLIDLTLNVSESVEISLIANGFSIYKYRKVLNAGSNQVSIMQNFEPLSSDKFSVYIEITPLTQQIVYLNYVSLFAWGNLNNDTAPSYQALEIGENYLISILDNNCLYSGYFDREENEYNLSDFTFIDNAISYSFVYYEEGQTLFLFRVDLNGNLFYSDFSSRYEIFITDNVACVSADISNSKNILVTYIKNNQCYYFEIDENSTISIHKKLYSNYNYFSKSLCYYNKYREKFLIILSNSTNGNYLIEQLSEDFFDKNSVVAEYSFSVSTNGSE